MSNTKKAASQQEEAEGERSEAETAKVRDATLKRMLNTPPKPHKDAPNSGRRDKKRKANAVSR